MVSRCSCAGSGPLANSLFFKSFSVKLIYYSRQFQICLCRLFGQLLWEEPQYPLVMVAIKYMFRNFLACIFICRPKWEAQKYFNEFVFNRKKLGKPIS
jgi:hypothetical protein